MTVWLCEFTESFQCWAVSGFSFFDFWNFSAVPFDLGRVFGFFSFFVVVGLHFRIHLDYATNICIFDTQSVKIFKARNLICLVFTS